MASGIREVEWGRDGDGHLVNSRQRAKSKRPLGSIAGVAPGLTGMKRQGQRVHEYLNVWLHVDSGNA